MRLNNPMNFGFNIRAILVLEYFQIQNLIVTRIIDFLRIIHVLGQFHLHSRLHRFERTVCSRELRQFLPLVVILF